ncbi:MAG: hypothetical protein GY765_30545 [bacterium]|nr:hypothetical protein [bacterium]
MEFLTVESSKNNHSQVIKVSDAYHSFLFPGDIEEEIESELSGTQCDRLNVSVLKVPHHGSRTSSTPSFLDCVAPETAVFSYGHKNRFKFPHREVMYRYKEKKINHLSTARRGGIKLTSLPESIRVETSR